MSSPFPIQSVNITPLIPETKATDTEQVIRSFVVDGKKFKATFTFAKKQTTEEREAAIKSLMPHIEECTKLFKIGTADPRKARTTSRLVINTSSGESKKFTYLRTINKNNIQETKNYKAEGIEKRLQKMKAITSALLNAGSTSTSLSSHRPRTSTPRSSASSSSAAPKPSIDSEIKRAPKKESDEPSNFSEIKDTFSKKTLLDE